MAIVLFIIGLALAGSLMPISAQIEQQRIKETRHLLDEARDALMGFAAANHRLPCPASETSNGKEDFEVSGGNATNGRCRNNYDGYLPAVTLGLSHVDSDGYALDAWQTAQNRIRYAVFPGSVNGADNRVTSIDGIKHAGIEQFVATASSMQMLSVCSSAVGITPTGCTAATELTRSAVAILYSVGPNAGTNGGTAPDEAANPNPAGGSADSIFVSHDRTQDFDDIVTWISINSLVNTLINAGALP